MNKDKLLNIGITEEQAEIAFKLYEETLAQTLEGYTPNETVAALEAEKERLAISSQEKEGQLEEFKKIARINEELLKIGAKNIKTVKALLDVDSISLDGEYITGLAEQLETIIDSDPYLFNTPAAGPETAAPIITGREPYNGSHGSMITNDERRNPFKKEYWNVTKQMQIYQKDKELYERLKAAAGIKD